MTDLNPKHQEIFDALSLTSRHLSSASAALAQSVSDEFGLKIDANTAAAAIGAAPMIANFSEASVKRARILSANAAQAADAAVNVANVLRAFAAATSIKGQGT